MSSKRCGIKLNFPDRFKRGPEHVRIVPVQGKCMPDKTNCRWKQTVVLIELRHGHCLKIQSAVG